MHGDLVGDKREVWGGRVRVFLETFYSRVCVCVVFCIHRFVACPSIFEPGFLFVAVSYIHTYIRLSRRGSRFFLGPSCIVEFEIEFESSMPVSRGLRSKLSVCYRVSLTTYAEKGLGFFFDSEYDKVFVFFVIYHITSYSYAAIPGPPEQNPTIPS